MKRETHIIDATGIVLGFAKNVDDGDFVVVKNFKNVKITGKKLEQEKDYYYTGHMGGQKEVVMGKLMEKKPSEVLRRAVYRMLPTNKLRDLMIKRLTVRQ